MQDVHFVGREAELARMRRLWDAARAGQARFCFVTGEAGSGKSTLARAFTERAREDDPTTITAVGNCDPQTGESDAYLPFLTLLEHLAGAVNARAATGSETANRIKSVLGTALKTLVEHAPGLLGNLVPGGTVVVEAARYAAQESGLIGRLEASVTEGGGPAAPEQEKIFRHFAEFLRAVAGTCPLILLIEDMHWADGASVELLFHLARALERERILVVATYRANDVAMGRAGARHPLETPINELKRYLGDVWIDLDRGADDERRAFVAALVDREPNRLGGAFREALFRHTGGHPLFAVELLSTLQERGALVRDASGSWEAAGEIDWTVLPTRVEGVIEERIGRLSNELREVLTVASVEDVAFTTEVTARLCQMRERELLRVLSTELQKRHRLVVEGPTERVGKVWTSQYTFAHALFQQYLYNGLPGRERMLLHGDVAALLEELYAGHTERVALQLARHWDLAGESEKAVDHYLAASGRMLAGGAYSQARGLAERACELLADLPPGEESMRRELEVLARLVTVESAVEGWSSPVLPPIYYRIRELCGELGDRAALPRVLFGLWSIHLIRLDLKPALRVAREYFDLASELGERDSMVQAHTAMGTTQFWTGRAVEAYASGQAALALYTPGMRAAHTERFGQDPRVIPVMLLTYSSWLLGRLDRTYAHIDDGLRVAEESGHPFTQAFARVTVAFACGLLRDPEGVRANARATLDIGEHHGFRFLTGQAMMLAGSVEKDAERGLALIEDGHRMASGDGGRSNHSIYSMMRAGVLLRERRFAEAREVLARGVEVATAAGEGWATPDLMRGLAAASAALGPTGVAQAEPLLRDAVRIARELGLPMPELRALTSLAQLLRQTRGDATAVLSELRDALERVAAVPGNLDLAEAGAVLAFAASASAA
ncbi:MAG TPA: AAA family ATPase [Longimicrobium sp.]|nr:AAA family ATPase [Longimicrobium sp.]